MTAPVKKNDRLTVYIEDLTHDGAGVAKVDGYPLFIQGGLPDETAEVHVLKTLKTTALPKLSTSQNLHLTASQHHALYLHNVAVVSYNTYHTKGN